MVYVSGSGPRGLGFDSRPAVFVPSSMVHWCPPRTKWWLECLGAALRPAGLYAPLAPRLPRQAAASGAFSQGRGPATPARATRTTCLWFTNWQHREGCRVPRPARAPFAYAYSSRRGYVMIYPRQGYVQPLTHGGSINGPVVQLSFGIHGDFLMFHI